MQPFLSMESGQLSGTLLARRATCHVEHGGRGVIPPYAKHMYAYDKNLQLVVTLSNERGKKKEEEMCCSNHWTVQLLEVTEELILGRKKKTLLQEVPTEMTETTISWSNIV